MNPLGVTAARFFHLDGWNGWHFTGGAPSGEVRFDRSGLYLPPSERLPPAAGRSIQVEARGLAFDRAGMPTAVRGDRCGFCLVGGRQEAPPAGWGLPPGHRLGAIAIDARGRLYVTLPDRGEVRVLRLSPPGEVARIEGLRSSGLAVDGRGRLFVLSSSSPPPRLSEPAGIEVVPVWGVGGDAIAASREGLLAIVSAGGTELRIGRAFGLLARVELGRPALPAIAFDPTQPASEEEAFVFIGDQISGRVVRWRVARGEATPTAWSDAVDAWAALAPRGDAVFGLGTACEVRPIALEPEGFTTPRGQVVLGPLDAGLPQTEWHRITALIESPSAMTSVRVEFFASDDCHAYDPDVAGPDARWTPPRQLVVPRPGRPAELALSRVRPGEADAAPPGVRGRYAWLRLTLHGDGRRTPRVKWVRVEYPRDSYLRYLPAIYSEEPESRDLTARFLSIFEAVEVDIGAVIGGLHRLFEPLAGDPGFFPWLAARLDLVLDPSWPVARQREILAAAVGLYRRRGTRAALETMLSWYGGPGIRVVEGWQLRASFVLGQDAVASCAMALPGGCLPGRMELGWGRALGAARIDARPDGEVEALLAGRGEILVLVPPSACASPAQLARLQRVAEREAPAGAVVRILSAASSPRVSLGRAGRLDIDAGLGGPAPWRLSGEREEDASGPQSGAHEPLMGADLALGIGPRLGMNSRL